MAKENSLIKSHETKDLPEGSFVVAQELSDQHLQDITYQMVML